MSFPMRWRAGALLTTLTLAAASFTATPAATAAPEKPSSSGDKKARDPRAGGFERIATFTTPTGGAEIIGADSSDQELVYTDAGAGSIGFVNLSSPTRPGALATFDLATAGHPGEPTSAAYVPGSALVLTAVAGEAEDGLAVIRAGKDPELLRWLPLPGQPDSVSVTDDGRYAAIAIENELSPEVPGELVIADLNDTSDPETWTLRQVALTGLAELRPDDPEPEFIDIRGELVAVTLQENNHVALVDLPSGEVVDHWTVGTSTHAADITDDGEIAFTDQIVDSPRLPDALAWTAAGQLVTANEGEDDLTGGRGFTVFEDDGAEVFDPGADFELQAVGHGHYPDGRSDAKGTEPEGAETGTFDGMDHLFVGSERGNFVAVYTLDETGLPTFRQLLPTGDEPEGLLAIEGRGLFLASNEADGTISIYQRRKGASGYPDVVSDHTIGWGALSGLAVSDDDDTVYAVPDSSFAPSRIFTVDVGADPAVITDETVLTDDTGAPVSLDPEGLATRRHGEGEPDPGEGWWLASEGDEKSDNLLAEVDTGGTVVSTVTLPPAVAADKLPWGFEGVATTGAAGTDDEQVYVAFQREWTGDQPGLVRIGRYTPSTGSWAFFAYPLEAPNPSDDELTFGLSELVALDDTTFAVIERDSAAGAEAEIKRIYRFSIDGVEPTPCPDDAGSCPGEDGSLVTDKVLITDLLAAEDLRLEKVEGLAVLSSGDALVVTDNDGAGETRLLRLDEPRFDVGSNAEKPEDSGPKKGEMGKKA